MARAKLPPSNLMVMKVCFSAATAGVQPLKYSAKELDRENGLDLYDSHARFYDSMIGRTTSQDPLAEKYSGVSPYLWCAANPIKFIDKNGKQPVKYIDENGIKRISFNIHIVDVDNTSNTKKADELSTQYKQEIKDNQPGKKWKGSSFYEWQYKWCIWIDTESNIYNNIFWRTKWNKIS